MAFRKNHAITMTDRKAAPLPQPLDDWKKEGKKESMKRNPTDKSFFRGEQECTAETAAVDLEISRCVNHYRGRELIRLL